MSQGDNKGDSGLGFVSGLLIGGFVGAVVAILFAPQSGEETREYLRDKAQEATGRAIDAASDLRERASAIADDLRAQADELQRRSRGLLESAYDQVNKAVNAGKDAAKGTVDDLKRQ